MKWLDYTITATARVSPGSSPAIGNDRVIHLHLPGSVVRGALAAAYARKTGMRWAAPSDDFLNVFEGDAVFGQGMRPEAELRSMSMVKCKYPTSDECLTELVDQAERKVAGEAPLLLCPGCNRGLSSGTGWDPSGARKRSSTRTELDRRGVALDEHLFTRNSMERETRFVGRIGVPDEAEAVIQWLKQGPELRVGGQLSVLGSAELTATDAPDPGAAQPGGTGILTFLSPGILLDEHGAPTLDPEAELKRALGDDDVQIVASWVRAEEVWGWHAASNLPKPHDWAVAAGSTFVVENLSADAGALLQRGVGWRVLEGFGQVRIRLADAPAADAPQETVADVSTRDTRPPAQVLIAAGSGLDHQQRLKRLAQYLRQLANAKDAGDDAGPERVRKRHIPVRNETPAAARSALDVLEAASASDLKAAAKEIEGRTR